MAQAYNTIATSTAADTTYDATHAYDDGNTTDWALAGTVAGDIAYVDEAVDRWGIITVVDNAGAPRGVTVDAWRNGTPTNGVACAAKYISDPGGAAVNTANAWATNDHPGLMYDWLKHNARTAGTHSNDAMGAVSAANERKLSYGWCQKLLAEKWTLDTDYINIANRSGIEPYATMADGGGIAVEQTANTVNITGVTFNHEGDTANDYSFMINPAVSNTASTYIRCHFTFDGSAYANKGPCFSASAKDFEGTWINCTGTDYSFRLIQGAGDTVFAPTMISCHAGGQSFGGDYIRGTMKGKYYNCSSIFALDLNSIGSFAACAIFGMPIHADAEFWYCTASSSAFALGKECAGFFFGCVSGNRSFGASVNGSYQSSFTGTAINCIAAGDNVFGMNTGGTGVTIRTGQMINCLTGATITPTQLATHYARWKDINSLNSTLRARYGGRYFNSPRAAP